MRCLPSLHQDIKVFLLLFITAVECRVTHHSAVTRCQPGVHLSDLLLQHGYLCFTLLCLPAKPAVNTLRLLLLEVPLLTVQRLELPFQAHL